MVLTELKSVWLAIFYLARSDPWSNLKLFGRSTWLAIIQKLFWALVYLMSFESVAEIINCDWVQASVQWLYVM